MAFDVSAGLAQMGETTSKVAGASLLETQKHELEKQKIVLADELAGKRQDKQNEFIRGEREASQVHQADQNDKNREAQIKAHQISAGATIAGHQISAAAIDRQIAAMAPERDATVAAKKIETESKKFLLDAQTAYQTAVKGGNTEEIAKTKAALEAAQFATGEDTKKVMVQANAVKLAETDLANVRSKMTEFETKNPGGPTTDTAKALAQDLKRQLSEAEALYKAEAARYRALRDGVLGNGPSSGRKDLGALPGAPGTPAASASATATTPKPAPSAAPMWTDPTSFGGGYN